MQGMRIACTSLCLGFRLILHQSPIVKKYDLSSVYFVMCAAAPLSAELQEQLVRMLPNCFIGQGYGLSPLACPPFLYITC